MAQRQPESPWQALMAFGSGVLNSRGGNWFGAGAQALQQAMTPENMSILETLQANNELWELDQRRKEQVRSRKQQEQRQQYLQAIVNDPNVPAQMRQQAELELSGLSDVLSLPEPVKPEWKVTEHDGDLVRYDARSDAAPTVIRQGAPDEDSAWAIRDDGRGPYWYNKDTMETMPVDQSGLPPEPETPDLTPKERLSFANTVTDDWRQETAPLTIPLQKFEDIEGYDADNLTPAQQRALVVNFAKFLDPTSAVMENEAEAIEMAGQSFPELQRLWRRAVDGNLKPDVARSVIAEMRALADKRRAELGGLYGRFSDRLRLGGIEDPTPWIGGPPTPPPAAQDLPPGTDLGGGFSVGE
jgi:hypothetical protein